MIAHDYLKIYTWEDVMFAATSLADRIAVDGVPELIIGIPRGGMVISTLLAELMNRDLLTLYVSRREDGREVYKKPIVKCSIPAELIRGKTVLLADEITVTGQTMETAKALLEELGASEVRTCVIVDRSCGTYTCNYYYANERDDCSIFPWDYLVRSNGGTYYVHPEYLSMDGKLCSNLYERQIRPEVSDKGKNTVIELPNESLKRLAALFLEKVRKNLGDVLLAMYLYGSVLSNDYVARSDIDFVVLLRTLPSDAEDRIRTLHRELSEIHPTGATLQGGYHVVEDDSAVGIRMGIWVDKQVEVECCELELEPDSAASIIDHGLILCGSPLEKYYPKPDHQKLLYFSKQFLLSYEEGLPERLNSDGHFFSSILNACRSICYCSDGLFPTKTQAAKRVEELLPDDKALLEKALAYRDGSIDTGYTNEDICACREFITHALKSII